MFHYSPDPYILSLRDQYEHGTLRSWKFKLFRKTTALLVQYAETGAINWAHFPQWHPSSFASNTFATRLAQYRHRLDDLAYGRGTRHLYTVVAKQFLRYLEHAESADIEGVTLKDVSEFIPYAATLYQPTSMRTVLSAIRHFLRFAEDAGLTTRDLVKAVPKSFGRKTSVVPTLKADETP